LDERVGDLWRARPCPLALGAIVAVAVMTRCERTETVAHTLPPDEVALGDYSPGRFAWFLDAVAGRREPVPARGSLGLWGVASEAEAAVMEQVARRRNEELRR
jgi:hypothetical protein